MMQSDKDRMARNTALSSALKHHESFGEVDDVVATAEKFRAFLTGAATTTTEGTE